VVTRRISRRSSVLETVRACSEQRLALRAVSILVLHRRVVCAVVGSVRL
jgi:hypothetical protein